MKAAIRELPGFVSVRGAGERLRLAPRSVRDLIYTGRLPSVRLGRRHYLRTSDLELERRRRLGLPLPARASARTRSSEERRPRRPALAVVGRAGLDYVDDIRGVPPAELSSTEGHPARQGGPSTDRTARRRAVDTTLRRLRAVERQQQLERWLRSGQRPEEPSLPFALRFAAAAGACEACGRAVRAGGRYVDAQAADGRERAELCLTCARRTLLSWADERRREAVAARQLARDLAGSIPSIIPGQAA